MSRDSERLRMTEDLAAYAMMKIRQLADFLNCSYKVAKKMVDDGTIPSVPVGAGKRVDPMVACVHVLAANEGVTPEEFHEIHGEAVPHLVRDYYRAIRVLQAA